MRIICKQSNSQNKLGSVGTPIVGGVVVFCAGVGACVTKTGGVVCTTPIGVGAGVGAGVTAGEFVVAVGCVAVDCGVGEGVRAVIVVGGGAADDVP